MENECCDALRTLDLELDSPEGNSDDLLKHSIAVIIEKYNELLRDDEAPIERLNWAKNRLLYQIQQNEGKFFTFDMKKIYKNLMCKVCDGRGFKRIRQFGEVQDMDKCFDCLGSGLASKQCTCQRTKTCTLCNGKGKVPLHPKKTCLRCRGRKFLNRKVSTGNILGFYTCTCCLGKGFVIPRSK